MIFDIQKCSIHDGNGLRTLVFFKGCPLRCKWCANPESQSYRAEIMEAPKNCIGCGACVKVCPAGAIQVDNEMRIDREKCTSCFQCVDRCFSEAKYLVGKEYDVDGLYKEIEKDKIFYDIRGGGVTFSGGEPLTQPRFLTDIARRCHEEGVHVQIESCGYGEFEQFRSALPFIDAMFIDVKQMDPFVHRELTGVGNERILENIRKIDAFGIPITVRTPVVPGCNDSRENIVKTAEFIRSLEHAKGYELLPYHRFGVGKYKALGRDYLLPDIEPPSEETMLSLVREANAVLAGSGKCCYYTKDNDPIIAR